MTLQGSAVIFFSELGCLYHFGLESDGVIVVGGVPSSLDPFILLGSDREIDYCLGSYIPVGDYIHE